MEKHTWANYFLAAYKVRLFAAWLPSQASLSAMDFNAYALAKFCTSLAAANHRLRKQCHAFNKHQQENLCFAMHYTINMQCICPSQAVCWLQGVFEFLEKQGKAPVPVGLQVMLHGQVPTGMPLVAATHACLFVAVPFSPKAPALLHVSAPGNLLSWVAPVGCTLCSTKGDISFQKNLLCCLLCLPACLLATLLPSLLLPCQDLPCTALFAASLCGCLHTWFDIQQTTLAEITATWLLYFAVRQL